MDHESNLHRSRISCVKIVILLFFDRELFIIDRYRQSFFTDHDHKTVFREECQTTKFTIQRYCINTTCTVVLSCQYSNTVGTIGDNDFL